MRVKLLRDQRIKHNAGEIVEVSPEVANFLISTNSAEYVKEAVEDTEKPKRGRKQK